VVVILGSWSKASIKSDWVQEEADDAKQRGILVPIRIEDVKPPIGFGSIQAADLLNWNAEEPTEAFRGLIVDITERIGPPPNQDPNRPIAREAANQTSGSVGSRPRQLGPRISARADQRDQPKAGTFVQHVSGPIFEHTSDDQIDVERAGADTIPGIPPAQRTSEPLSAVERVDVRDGEEQTSSPEIASTERMLSSASQLQEPNDASTSKPAYSFPPGLNAISVSLYLRIVGGIELVFGIVSFIMFLFLLSELRGLTPLGLLMAVSFLFAFVMTVPLGIGTLIEAKSAGVFGKIITICLLAFLLIILNYSVQHFPLFTGEIEIIIFYSVYTAIFTFFLFAGYFYFFRWKDHA
jgi:hypothetical protein